MLNLDAFTHFVAINPIPHCNAYYAYTTVYENWKAKFGLPEILVPDELSVFFNNEINTLCYLYTIKDKLRKTHAPWTNGLVKGIKYSLKECLRCLINNDDRKTKLNKSQKLMDYHHIKWFLTSNQLSR